MTRLIVPLLAVVVATGACATPPAETTRSALQRDTEGYAVASCLTLQTQPFLKRQGDAWAAVIVQRMHGDLDAMTAIAPVVRREVARGDMAVAHSEDGTAKDMALPVLYCSEIIDQPAVRSAIRKAAAQLAPAYGAATTF